MRKTGIRQPIVVTVCPSYTLIRQEGLRNGKNINWTENNHLQTGFYFRRRWFLI